MITYRSYKYSGLIIIFLMSISCGPKLQAPFPFHQSGWDSTKTKVIDDQFLKLSDIIIGKSTFNDVVRLFGKSDIYRNDTKNYSPNLTCYSSEKDNVNVVFQSGPLGGWRTITAIWIGESKFIDKKRCKNSILFTLKNAQFNGLSLESSLKDIKSVLGKETFRKDTFLAYRFHDTIVMHKNKLFDVTSGFEFKIEKNTIKWLRIYKQLSN